MASADRSPTLACAQNQIEDFRKALGPFVVAAERTRMPMIFADAQLADHPLLFANDSFLALTGYERPEVVGLPLSHLFERLTDPATFAAISFAIESSGEGTWEAKCCRANGDEYLATVFLSPVADEAGKVLQMFLSFVEVSRRLDRLLEQRDTFAELYAKAPGFIATSEGPQHRFTYANKSYEELIGQSDLVGRTVAEVMPGLKEQGVIELLDRVFKTGMPFLAKSMPLRLGGTDGRKSVLRYLNFIYQPVRDNQGIVTGLFVEGHDVTEERAAAEHLERLHDELAHAWRVNAMGMMAATLAHELNQPLTAISSYVGACLRLVDGEARNAEALTGALQEVQQAAQRAGDTIRNIRELTRRGETTHSEFNISDAIIECVKLVRAGGCLGATIEDHVAGDLRVVGDRIQIQQVVINLLSNACDAPSGDVTGRVTIEASREADSVIVAVADSGRGLSRAAAENIFTWTDSSKEGGTGLGLAISRTIVESHKGRIWLQRSDANGSQFCFSLPLAATRTGDNHAR